MTFLGTKQWRRNFKVCHPRPFFVKCHVYLWFVHHLEVLDFTSACDHSKLDLHFFMSRFLVWHVRPFSQVISLSILELPNSPLSYISSWLLRHLTSLLSPNLDCSSFNQKLAKSIRLQGLFAHLRSYHFPTLNLASSVWNSRPSLMNWPIL